MQNLVNPPLCKCGCGKEVTWRSAYKRWNIYIFGHHKRKIDFHEKISASKGIAPLCACGCGGEVLWGKQNRCWNKFILYHSSKVYGKIIAEKMGKANRGKKFTKEHRKKLSDAHKGVPLSKEHIKNSAKAHRGLKRSEESKRKTSETLKGHAPFFVKGIKAGDFDPEYCDIWKDQSYKEECRKSYCEICGITNRLSLHVCGTRLHLHHKDFNKKNCYPSNLGTVCASCHTKEHYLEVKGR
jgi:hypothetical protein